MERDFMGLKSKDCVIVVKEEVGEEGCKDTGFAKCSEVPWQLSNTVSAFPHFVSLKSEQDEKPSTIFGGATIKQQFPCGNPFTAPHSICPKTASVAGTTEQWIGSMASGIPAQLTIFYAGTINVFDGIFPEKAQAIMLLAGNACVANMAQSKLHVLDPNSKLPAEDGALVNQSMNMPPCSGLPSPMSVSSHPIDQSGVAAAHDDEIKVSKSIGMSTTIVNIVEPQRMASSLGSVVTTAMISSAVPQARKASLARFLEKRKERVMNASPYNLGKKAADCATPESNAFGLSATSGVSSCSMSSSKAKEISGDV